MNEVEATALAKRVLTEDNDVMQAQAQQVGKEYEVEVTFISVTYDDVTQRVNRNVSTVSKITAKGNLIRTPGELRLWGFFIDKPGQWDIIRTLKAIPLEEAIEREDTEDAVVRYFENMPTLMLERCLYNTDMLDALEKRGYSRDSVQKVLERLTKERFLYRASRGKYCQEAA